MGFQRSDLSAKLNDQKPALGRSEEHSRRENRAQEIQDGIKPGKFENWMNSPVWLEWWAGKENLPLSWTAVCLQMVEIIKVNFWDTRYLLVIKHKISQMYENLCVMLQNTDL